MNIKTIILSVVLGLGLIGGVSSTFAGAEDNEVSPVEVEVIPDFKCFNETVCVNYYAWSVTAVDEGVIVKDFKINRGNCDVSYNYSDNYRTKKLPYGQSLEFKSVTNDTLSKCRPVEATVVTNKGTWTFDMR